MGKLTWVGMRVGLELEDDGPIGEAGAVELLGVGVVTGGIDSVEEPLLGDGGRIGEAGPVELLGVVTGDDGVVEAPLPINDGAVEAPLPINDGVVEVPLPIDDGVVEVPLLIDDGAVEVPLPIDDGAVEAPLPMGEGGVVEVPLPINDGCVSTPWISIPPAATGGDGRIGEEGAVELLGVVTCDIRFLGNKNYSRWAITAHETNSFYAPKPNF